MDWTQFSTIVAIARHHHQAGIIATLNVVLGWTILAWVGALGWSFTHPAPVRKD